MKKSSALICTLQILKKIFSQQVIWIQSQMFGNAEIVCVVVVIPFSNPSIDARLDSYLVNEEATPWSETFVD